MSPELTLPTRPYCEGTSEAVEAFRSRQRDTLRCRVVWFATGIPRPRANRRSGQVGVEVERRERRRWSGLQRRLRGAFEERVAGHGDAVELFAAAAHVRVRGFGQPTKGGLDFGSPQRPLER